MANSSAMCTSFKREILLGHHNLGTGVVRATTAADTLKGALYLTTASISAASTAYTTSGEASGSGYIAGGATVTNDTAPDMSGTTAFWTPSASLAWTSVTLATPFDALMIYNVTQSSKAISTHVFGAQTVTAGNFSLTMPANDGTNALLRIT